MMGGGLYLVFPAFYTEVSDSYRLDRRGRLRVDLGGLYFSAVFAVGAFGLWALTGTDALLLVVAVQMVQMVRQLPPIIRADGYHIVSDLVGVPDLFAHIKPTLLAAIPFRGRKRRGHAQAVGPAGRDRLGPDHDPGAARPLRDGGPVVPPACRHRLGQRRAPLG